MTASHGAAAFRVIPMSSPFGEACCNELPCQSPVSWDEAPSADSAVLFPSRL